jgi:hypothetical protein
MSTLPTIEELADRLVTSGWCSAHVVDTGLDEQSVRIDVPGYAIGSVRVAARALYLTPRGWTVEATEFPADSLEPCRSGVMSITDLDTIDGWLHEHGPILEYR